MKIFCKLLLKIHITNGTRDLSDTRGYATPATPNAQWFQPTLCRYQNQPCVPSGYQSGYLLPYPTWENPKPRFWHFEPWFLKVLENFENMFLYIIVSSFGSEGARGRFLCPPLVRWERDAIQPSFLPFRRLQCFVEIVCTRKPWWSNPHHRLTPIARCFTGLSFPHPPKPPSNWLTDKRSELIYKIAPIDHMFCVNHH